MIPRECSLDRKPTVIFDLDGVLCDNNHRLHFIFHPDGSRKEKADWHSFFEESDKDSLIPAGKALYLALFGCFEVVFLTGRNEKYRDLTERWLTEKLGRDPCLVYMRLEMDYAPAHQFKGEMLEELSNYHEIILVVDDSQIIIDEAVRRGFTALHFRRPGEQQIKVGVRD